MTLADFLLARIAEDEAVALQATGGDRTGNWWADIDPDGGHGAEVSCLDVVGFVTAVDVDAEHIARHDPARVLAECKAKRAIVWHLAAYGREGLGDFRDGYTAGMEDSLRHLATPYATHPDYRAEWAL